MLPSIGFSILHSFLQQMSILWHFGGSQEQGRVGGCIGRFVLRDSWNTNEHKENELCKRSSKGINKLSLSYFRSRPNQRRLWCIFWAVQVWRPYFRGCSLQKENRMPSHAAEAVSGCTHGVRQWFWSAVFLKRKRNKMADGGLLTRAAATGDLKVWCLKTLLSLCLEMKLTFRNSLCDIDFQCKTDLSISFQSVKDILDRGVDVNSFSPEGFRPICIAAFWAYNNIVQLLLDRG